MWTPDGVVGRHLEQVVQAVLTEGVRAWQDTRVSKQRVADRAGQVLLQVVHDQMFGVGRSGGWMKATRFT